jgi:hypothetical protein
MNLPAGFRLRPILDRKIDGKKVSSLLKKSKVD